MVYGQDQMQSLLSGGKMVGGMEQAQTTVLANQVTREGIKDAQALDTLTKNRSVLLGAGLIQISDDGTSVNLVEDWQDRLNAIDDGNKENVASALGLPDVMGDYFSTAADGNAVRKKNIKVFTPTASKNLVPTALKNKITVAKDVEEKQALENLAAEYTSGTKKSYVTPIINAEQKPFFATIFGTDADDDEVIVLSEEDVLTYLRARTTKLNSDFDKLNPEANTAQEIAKNSPLFDSVGVLGQPSENLDPSGQGGMGGAPGTNIDEKEAVEAVFDKDVGRPQTLSILDQLKGFYKDNPITYSPPAYEEEYEETVPAPKVSDGIAFNKEKEEAFKEINRERSSNKTRFPLLKNSGPIQQLLPELQRLQAGNLEMDRNDRVKVSYPASTGLFQFWKGKQGNEGFVRGSDEWRAVGKDPAQMAQLATEYEAGIKQEISNAGIDLAYFEDYQQGDGTVTGGPTTVTKTRTITPDPIVKSFDEAFPGLEGLTGDELDGKLQELIESNAFTGFEPAQVEAITNHLETEDIKNIDEFVAKEKEKNVPPEDSYKKLYMMNMLLADRNLKMPGGSTVKDVTDSQYNQYFYGTGYDAKSFDEANVKVFDSNTTRMNAVTNRMGENRAITKMYNDAAVAASTADNARYDKAVTAFGENLNDLELVFKEFSNDLEGYFDKEEEIKDKSLPTRFRAKLMGGINDFTNSALESNQGRDLYKKAKKDWESKTDLKFTNEVFAYYYAQPAGYSQVKQYGKSILFQKVANSLQNKEFGRGAAFTDGWNEYWDDVWREDRAAAANLNSLENTLAVVVDKDGKPINLVSKSASGQPQEDSVFTVDLLDQNFLTPGELFLLYDTLDRINEDGAAYIPTAEEELKKD